jgi:hypothetical protein
MGAEQFSLLPLTAVSACSVDTDRGYRNNCDSICHKPGIGKRVALWQWCHILDWGILGSSSVFLLYILIATHTQKIG